MSTAVISTAIFTCPGRAGPGRFLGLTYYYGHVLPRDVMRYIAIYRVGQIKRGQLTFLLVTIECIYKIK